MPAGAFVGLASPCWGHAMVLLLHGSAGSHLQRDDRVFRDLLLGLLRVLLLLSVLQRQVLLHRTLLLATAGLTLQPAHFTWVERRGLEQPTTLTAALLPPLLMRVRRLHPSHLQSQLHEPTQLLLGCNMSKLPYLCSPHLAAQKPLCAS